MPASARSRPRRRIRDAGDAAPRSMLPPETSDHDRAARPCTLPASSAAMPTAPRRPRRSRAPRVGVADAGGDLVLGERAPRRRAGRAHMAKRIAVVEADAAAQRIGQRLQLLDRAPGAPAREARMHGRAALHRDADHARPAAACPSRRRRRRRRARRPTAAPAPARHRADRSTISSPIVPWPGDHARIVEGRDLASDPPRAPAGRPRPAHRPGSGRRCGFRAPSARTASTLFSGTRADMHTTARAPAAARRMRQGAPVIAGRGGDEAAPAGSSASSDSTRVGGAAQLEAAGRLAGLELQMDRARREPPTGWPTDAAACATTRLAADVCASGRRCRRRVMPAVMPTSGLRQGHRCQSRLTRTAGSLAAARPSCQLRYCHDTIPRSAQAIGPMS